MSGIDACVHRDYIYLLVKKADWVVGLPLHNIFVVFEISLQILTNLMETAGRVHVTKSKV